MFNPRESKTLSKVKIFVSAVAGTLANGDLVCDLSSMPTGIQSGTNGPSATLQTSSTVTSVPTGAQWVEFTGFTTALTAGTLYGLVIRNANATPGTNNFTIRFVIGGTPLVHGSATLGWAKKHSTDSGATWVTNVGSISGIRLEFSDGTFSGTPASNGATTAVGDGIYSNRELGVKFTTPSDIKIRISAIVARMLTTGSPTGSPRFRLYEDTTLLATTESTPQYQSNNYHVGVFATPQILNPNTTYRIMAGETTQSDASTNRFNLTEYTIENDANSKALMPFGGWFKTLFDGTSFTDTETSAIVMWMYLDADDLFDQTTRSFAT